jgi:hypothetical protein
MVKKAKEIKKKRDSQPVENTPKVAKPSENKAPPEKPVVTTKRTGNITVLIISGMIAGVGLILFIAYFFTLNMVMGAPGIILTAAGIFWFYRNLKTGGDTVAKHIGETSKAQVNSLCLYPYEIKFEDVYEPAGQLMKCRNDGKYYHVNIQNGDNKLVAFMLPDTQYMDPEVFAQRVLELPAHRKIFTRRQDLFQKLKPLFIILGIIIVWILILTTT